MHGDLHQPRCRSHQYDAAPTRARPLATTTRSTASMLSVGVTGRVEPGSTATCASFPARRRIAALRRAPAQAKASPSLDVLVLLLLSLGGLLRVARRQLHRLLRGYPGLQLAAALQLRVELCSEQEGKVGQPQPQQEDDDSGEGAVGLVVAGEVGDVEPEERGDHDPGEDRDDGTDADPPELRLLHV